MSKKLDANYSIAFRGKNFDILFSIKENCFKYRANDKIHDKCFPYASAVMAYHDSLH
jgi:hypothetical protein